MGLQEITRNLMSDLLPAAAKRAGAVDRLVADSSGMLHDALARQDRSAPALLSRMNQPILDKFPSRLKLKYEHMAISPRRFMTGEPELYAYDMRGLLAQHAPLVPIQGDLHLNNFGAMPLANGHVKVRLNDFDMAYAGPAAFDLNRMATHIVLTAQEKGLSDKEARGLVANFAGAYHDTLSAIAQHAEPPANKMPAILKDVLEHAKKRDPQAWLDHEVPSKHGQRAFVRSGSVKSVSSQVTQDMQQAFETYRAGLAPQAAKELAPYRVSDVVDVLSGTGSMGSPRYHVLLEAKGQQPILLQLKEQGLSGAERYGPKTASFASGAQRNVTIANLMDGGLDPFRGAATLPARDALESRSFLVERRRPTDVGLDIADVKKKSDFAQLVRYYGAQTAKAQARGAGAGYASPEAILAGLGDKQTLTQQLTGFGTQYAARVTQDYQAFVKALKRDPLLRKS